MNEYQEFLLSKTIKPNLSGITLNEKDLNLNLFKFQKFITLKALAFGKYAIFADCGLGKTLMQLEWAFQIYNSTGKRVLILAPLAVKSQTINEAKKFNIDLSGIDVQNYEQLSNIDESKYIGIVLDESSILKNFTGKYRNMLIEKFEDTSYKLCCTATPSPNDPTELGNHSEFLGYMKRTEMLSMYFINDMDQVQNWRLKGHSVNEFYNYISSWSILLRKPSDIGYSDNGYELHGLNFIERQIKTSRTQNGMLFNDVAVNATNFNYELRRTMNDRLKKTAEIANNLNDPVIIWVKQNEESKKLSRLIPGSIEVSGSDSPNTKTNNLLGFANGDFRVLITKAKIAQFGLNYQHCNNQIFCSLDFSFESLYQAIRRSYRFGQEKDVNIYLITTDTMQNVVNSIRDKQRKFDEMSYLMIQNQKKCIQFTMETA